jgi:hypothetical protein
MLIDNQGNIGINTTSPGSLLDVNGILKTNTLLVNSTTNSSGLGTGGSLTVLGGGAFGKDVFVGGTITSSSDLRLKKNITQIPDSENFLDKIYNINEYTYNYKWENENATPMYGFVAQELLSEFPYLVKGSDDDLYSVDYQKMTVILLKCVKELHKKFQDFSKTV